MLPQSELEQLAERYVRDRGGRMAAPRCAEVRAALERNARAFRVAADAAAELGRHECAVAGVTLAEFCPVRKSAFLPK